MTSLDLSVLLVSYNTRDLLADCLRTLRNTVRALTYEVLVVDNASADGSAAMVATDFPEATSGVRLIANPDNRGFAAANNQAIALSHGRHVLLLNTDAVPEPGAIERMVAFLDAHPDVGIVGGQLRNPDGSFQGSYMDFPSLLGEVLLATKLAQLVYSPAFPSYPEGRSQTVSDADWVSGAFLMARRAAVDAVGPMDESYFMYTEETDWCYRMRRAGWRVVYLPEARVTHLVGASSRRAPERRRGQVYRGKWLFMRKHYGNPTAAVFHLVVRAVSAAKLVFWALRGLTPANPLAREHARQQVRSYAVLLSEL